MKSCQIDSDQLSQEQINNLKNIISKLPTDEALNDDADVIKALADPTRLKIIQLLSHGELCVCEIFCALEKPQPTISHHLNILKKSGFLKWRKEKLWTFYSLSSPNIIEHLNVMMETSKK